MDRVWKSKELMSHTRIWPSLLAQHLDLLHHQPRHFAVELSESGRSRLR
uniref:Uncharacterized protein n=1 Tax=Arundo donax TaxID=35708 RepID=A0A0A9AF72_ARUDO